MLKGSVASFAIARDHQSHAMKILSVQGFKVLGFNLKLFL